MHYKGEQEITESFDPVLGLRQVSSIIMWAK
jgi:hypothetical protein